MQRERNKFKSDQVRKTGFSICKSFSYSYLLTNFFYAGLKAKNSHHPNCEFYNQFSFAEKKATLHSQQNKKFSIKKFNKIFIQ